MKEEGFGPAGFGRPGLVRSSTVHAELFRLKNGRAQWDRRTLIVVDEAAMMDAKITGEVLREARLSGAKVVLAGDDRQLGSIERGGLFTELKKEHGSAEITQVTRQNVDWQREAARDLRTGGSRRRCGRSHETSRWSGRRSRMSSVQTGRAVGEGYGHRSVRVALRLCLYQQGCRCAEQGPACGSQERGELGEDFVFTTKHGEAAFAVGDRVQFTDTLKGAGIYNGNAGVITNDRSQLWPHRRDARCSGRPGGAKGRVVRIRVQRIPARLRRDDLQGPGQDARPYLSLHTHHWRAASSYVALTRQRESATIFVATETARDLRQLARQIGRNEIKPASVAYATRDELTVEQKAQLDETRAAELPRSKSGVAQVQHIRGSTMEAYGLTKDRDTRSEGSAEREAGESSPAGQQVVGQRPTQESQAAVGHTIPGEAGDRLHAGTGRDQTQGSASGDRPGETRKVLVAPFEAIGPDGIRRDSLGRSLEDKSIAAAVDGDADVQRERQARSIYIETAYRDPKTALLRLDDIVARDGTTSAAQRVSADVGLLGMLRGREGFFAGAKAREEREAATMAASAIGPNLVRTAEFEHRAAHAYRTEVEKRMQADGVEVKDISERAKAALARVAECEG